jgi:hypothetical protein
LQLCETFTEAKKQGYNKSSLKEQVAYNGLGFLPERNSPYAKSKDRYGNKS